MAHDVGWYRRQHKTLHDRIAELERQLAAVATSAAAAKDQAEHRAAAAAVQACAPLHARIAELELEVSSAQVILQATAESDQHWRTRAEAAEQERDRWKAAAEAAKPAVEAAEKVATDALALLERVTARMRRREREEQEALLNRVAYARATFAPVPVLPKEDR